MRQKTSIRSKLGWISFCTIFVTIIAGAIWLSIAKGNEKNRQEEAIRTNTQETVVKINRILDHIEKCEGCRKAE